MDLPDTDTAANYLNILKFGIKEGYGLRSTKPNLNDEFPLVGVQSEMQNTIFVCA